MKKEYSRHLPCSPPTKTKSESETGENLYYLALSHVNPLAAQGNNILNTERKVIRI